MKPLCTILLVIGVVAAARNGDTVTTEVLEGTGLGVQTTAALVNIGDTGRMFWMFHPSNAVNSTTTPIILWLDGVTGLPPSYLANFGMIGPLDLNMNKRDNSWVEEFNLLFVDAPLGTGFSTANSQSNLAVNFNETSDHLLHVLQSFYVTHEEYRDAPLYLYGQGDGAQLALHLTKRIHEAQVNFDHNLQGIVLANPTVSPALALTKLGVYLEEMGYVDRDGRAIVEQFSSELSALVAGGQMEDAYYKFLGLEEFLNQDAGMVATNPNYILQKLTKETDENNNFVQRHLRSNLQLVDFAMQDFMTQRVGPALGISNLTYDQQWEQAVHALKDVYMEPCVHLVEDILSNTNLSVTIINGNLDAISNTPGQLEWVNSLEWSGQEQFLNSPRSSLIVNRLNEGSFRGSGRLVFYWMNAAGVSVTLDSPTAMRRVIQRITGS